jgi:hypothetical protein
MLNHLANAFTTQHVVRASLWTRPPYVPLGFNPFKHVYMRSVVFRAFIYEGYHVLGCDVCMICHKSATYSEEHAAAISVCYHLPSMRQNYPLPTAARRGSIEVNCDIFENVSEESTIVVFTEISRTFSSKWQYEVYSFLGCDVIRSGKFADVPENTAAFVIKFSPALTV